MTTRPNIILNILAVVLTAPFAMGQSTEDFRSGETCRFGFQSTSSGAGYRGYEDSTRGIYPASYPGVDRSGQSSPTRDLYNHELNRLRGGYDYRAPLDSAVDDTFRTPVSYDHRYRGNDIDNGSGYRDYNGRGLVDPFRPPQTDDFRSRGDYHSTPLNRGYEPRSDYQSRYRIPLNEVDYSNFDRDYRPADRDRYNVPEPTNDFREWNPVPQSDRQQPGLDPFTPPLPRRDEGSEAESIFKAISARYGNPVNVRAVRAMSESQSLSLYREVSQQTDQRHLEPSSYDLRVRRGLRNMALALENPAFNQAFGLQADSFRMDGFRTTLSRIGERMRVSNGSDAQQVMQSVMQEARSVGLPGNVVAFEFASATIDTLDKFSALEPSEPGRGASLDLTENVRSAMLEGEIVGIGVEVRENENGLLIVKTLRGGPAAEAGLQSGDIVTAINGRSIQGMSMANSVDLMKGNEGSRIQMQIVRNGSQGNDVALTRRRVRVYTVNDVRIQQGTDKVAYISLSQFGQQSTQELDEALQQVYNSGMKSLILDMRGNPGGLLNVCVDITNRFLPCGTIVSTKGRLSSDNMVETASYSRTWSTPLVVLIDGDSASASEIFAAAVQDNRRGIVVGERSYGKGTVQTHFPLNTVSGNLRLTTARFYSPSGRAMSGEGVTPDVRIADADGPANGDRVLEEAIRIAQSQQLRDIAQAAAKCRPTTGQQPQRNSLKGDIYDSAVPKTVLR